MRKELLLMGLSLFSVTLSAQQIHSILHKKHRIENKTSIKVNQSENQERVKQNEFQKTLEAQVNTRIACHKLETMRKAIERASVTLLDEVIVEGSEKRTYTYYPDGKRDEERYFQWQNDTWQLDRTAKTIYTYDEMQRCTERSIQENGKEISKVTISYEAGNTFYKYYRTGSEEKLVPEYEKGYDAEKREILYKVYNERGILIDWRESGYDEKGNRIFTLYWNGTWGDYGSGTKEVIENENLKSTTKRYRWDSDKMGWYISEARTILYNDSKRELSKETIVYKLDGSVNWGERETNTYDAYNRIITTLFEEYTNGIFEYTFKDTYSYWGNQAYDPDSEEEEFDGPLLAYYSYDWENGEWVESEYVKIERNAQGVAIKATSKEMEEERIGNEYVFVFNEEVGTFDDKGNIIASEGTCHHENGTLLYNTKSEYEYNARNQNTRSVYYRKYPASDTWQLQEEYCEEYDTYNRTILSSNRHLDENNNWQGYKEISKYQFETNKDEYLEKTTYQIDSNGKFSTTPSNFRSRLLKGQIIETIYQIYENGVVINGNKEEEGTTSIKINLPDPETYTDNIEIGEAMETSGFTYSAYYSWENGDWFPHYKVGYQYDGNNIIVTSQNGNQKPEEIIYTYDDQKRIAAYVHYQDGEKTTEVKYSYNSDGLLSTRDENGVITRYIYSKHEVTGIEKATLSVLQINGRIIKTENAATLLQVYTTNGTLITNGIGTVTLPESGIYIVVTDAIRQKVMIQ